MLLRTGFLALFICLNVAATLRAQTTGNPPTPAQPAPPVSREPEEEPVPTPEPTPPNPPQPSPAPAPAPVPTPEPAPKPKPTPGDQKKKADPKDKRVSQTKTSRSRIHPKYRITKIHDFRNDDQLRRVNNRPMDFERDYWNHGAILAEEFHRKQGHYFVITWVNGDKRADFTTRFEYRQLNSRSTVRTLELSHKQIEGAERSIFAVTGDAYRTYGPISAWRFTVLKGEEVVAQDQSFVW
jgi:hypothetical protein